VNVRARLAEVRRHLAQLDAASQEMVGVARLASRGSWGKAVGLLQSLLYEELHDQCLHRPALTEAVLRGRGPNAVLGVRRSQSEGTCPFTSSGQAGKVAMVSRSKAHRTLNAALYSYQVLRTIAIIFEKQLQFAVALWWLQLALDSVPLHMLQSYAGDGLRGRKILQERLALNPWEGDFALD
jgi:hypothetical protein